MTLRIDYKCGILIQARTGSTRFPDKVLKPFARGRSVLSFLLERLGEAGTGLPIIVATSVNPLDDRIQEVATLAEVACFRGSEEDVRERFLGAADEHGLTSAIRICADNPLLDTGLLKDLLDAAVGSGSDYAAHVMSDATPTILMHLGLFAEYFRVEALERAASVHTDPPYREHVTNVFYEHPDSFSLEWLQAPGELATRDDMRLTVDTETDLETVRLVYERAHAQGPDTDWRALLGVVDASPDLKERMRTAIEENLKR